MVMIYRFAGVRPDRLAASAIAAVPYDVVTADEARAIIAKNPETFLRVSRPDAELPGLAPDDDRVYQRAHENFVALESDGRMKKDPTPGMYLYRVLQEDETFLGLCCCLDVEDSGKIISAAMSRHVMTKKRTGPGILRQLKPTTAPWFSFTGTGKEFFPLLNHLSINHQHQMQKLRRIQE
jgi:Uncharacterized conserved protein